MLGLGEDGHTASIFPGNIGLFNSPALFETVLHPATKQKRITATGKVINHAKLVVILATGESKSSRVAQVINHLDGWNELPAGHVRPENGKIIWLIDKMAAKELDRQTRG
jgi:6-phosphogluconolactonase